MKMTFPVLKVAVQLAVVCQSWFWFCYLYVDPLYCISLFGYDFFVMLLVLSCHHLLILADIFNVDTAHSVDLVWRCKSVLAF